MFSFLSPIWLFAAAAVIIPVVIHLWNIRPGKVLKVGSTALITAASRKSSRSFKLLDILLLILRCLLLILIALLLAIPVWQKNVQSAKAKGWVLLPKENFSETYQHFKPTVDSLTKAGYQFHFFNTGLPQADLTRLFAQTKDIRSIDTVLKQPSSYWDLLNQLDAQVASDMPVYLFTSNRLGHFTGEKPEVSMDLHWKTFTPADSVGSWVQDAWLNNSNNIHVVKGTAKPSGISYQDVNLQSDRSNTEYAVNVNNGLPSVSLTGSKQAVPVDTSVLRIAIYTDHYTADAGYLKAALDADAAYSQRKTVIKEYSAGAAIPANQSWVFWLADQSVPERLVQSRAKIFAYQSGKQVNADSWITPAGSYSLPTGAQQVPLFKLVATTNKQEHIIWQDGFGDPVLSSDNNLYRFYSRINPTWNDLPWNSNFPKLILQLITDTDKPIPAGFDKRTISTEQMQPVKINEQHTVTSKFTVQKELGLWFWLVAAIIFLAERWLATQNKLAQSND